MPRLSETAVCVCAEDKVSGETHSTRVISACVAFHWLSEGGATMFVLLEPSLYVQQQHSFIKAGIRN